MVRRPATDFANARRADSAAVARDDCDRRRLRHGGQSRFAGQRLSLRRDRYLAGRDLGSRGCRFSGVDFLQGFAPADLEGIIDRAKLVLLMDVLEHVPDDFRLFSLISAAIQPGAYLHVTVPANQRLWNRHDESFGHYRRYDRERLSQLWEGLPLKPLVGFLALQLAALSACQNRAGDQPPGAAA